MSRPSIDPAVAELQTVIWRQKPVGEKIRLVGLLWLQARILKRAMLRNQHPDWNEGQLDAAVLEAMSGRRN